jgi:hypothetical protein
LEPLVACGAFTAEVLEAPVAPNDAARQQHRAPRTAPLLVHDGSTTELARPRGGAEAGHPGARDEH